jgi:hypothetical protein
MFPPPCPELPFACPSSLAEVMFHNHTVYRGCRMFTLHSITDFFLSKQGNQLSSFDISFNFTFFLKEDDDVVCI